MCLLFLVRPTRGRSMGDVLSPQSFGLHPPTRGYDSSDLLRRSQKTIPYIREVGLLGGRILDICFDLRSKWLAQ